MATYYVNAATGNAGYDGLSETDLNAAIANRGPKLTIQAAVTAASAGDTIKVAGNATAYRGATGGIVINKSLTIEGDGGVIVAPFTDNTVNEPVFDIQVTAGATLEKVQLKKLKIKNTVAAAAVKSGNYGIKCSLGATANTKLNWLVLEDVDIVGMGDAGVYLLGGAGTNDYFIFTTFRRCVSNANYAEGFYLKNAVGVIFDTCYAIGNQLSGYRTEACTGISFLTSAAENNALSGSANATYDAQMRLISCNSATVISCDIEDFTSAGHTSKRGIVVQNSVGTHIGPCNFYNAALNGAADERCIYVTYGAGGGNGPNHVTIMPCNVSNVAKFLEVDSGDTNVDAFLPFSRAGGTPSNVLPTTMHMRSWT